jgi:RNA recognition motif-containing protein
MTASIASGFSTPVDEVDLEQRQTLWVGGINEKVNEEILYELFLNVRPYFIAYYRVFR